MMTKAEDISNRPIKTGPAVWKLFHTAGPFLFKTFLL